MTVSPVISGAPAQATAKARPSEASDDPSKNFSSYLRSSVQDDSEESSNGSVSERSSKTNKNEKQTSKKADADQAANTIAAPVPPLAEQPAPPLSITALLGLPTMPKSDTAETGKATNDNASTLSTTQSDALKSYPPALTSPQPKIDRSNTPALTNPQSGLDQPQSADAMNPLAFLDTTRPNAGTAVDPASSGATTSGATKNVELLTANAPPNESAPATTPGNLAFAMRLSENPVNSNSEQRAPQTATAEPIAGAAQTASADLATVVQSAAGPQLKEQSQQHDGSAGTALYEVPPTHQQNGSDASQPSSEPVAHTTAAALAATEQSATSEPVRNVHMQVVGDDNNRVDVHLTDRGGQLHVSVKSGDINLAQNLQDHMPELTSRLEQQRFQAEVWIPKLAENGKTEMSGTRDFSSSGNDSSNNSNNSNQQGKRQQQYQPDWLDVLENSTQGAGKINQTWLQ